MIESSMVEPCCCLERPKISLETKLLFGDIGEGYIVEKEFLEQTDIPEYRTYEGNIDIYDEGWLQLGNETRNRVWRPLQPRLVDAQKFSRSSIFGTWSTQE